MRFTHISRCWCLMIPALILAGCAGYKAGNISSADLNGVKTIYVPVVKNETYEPSIQVMFTNALIRSLENDGTFHTTRLAKADASLEVTITSFDRNPMLYSRDNTIVPLEFRGTMIAKITLINNLTGKTVYKDYGISAYTDYFTLQNSQQRDAVEAERQALPIAAQKLADKITARISEGW